MTRDFRFKQDEGKQIVDGKSVYPDMLRLELDKEQAFSLAMDLLRFIDASKQKSFPPIDKFEFTLFGEMRDLSEDQ